MEEKKSKGMYVVAVILAVLVVVLVALVGVFLLQGKSGKPGGSGNAGPFSQDGGAEKTAGSAKKVDDGTAADGGTTADDGSTADGRSATDDGTGGSEDKLYAGEKKEQSCLKFKGEKVTFRIPDGFYSSGTYNADSYKTENFSTADYVFADCALWSVEESGYPDAQTYIEAMLDFQLDNAKKGVKLESRKIDGRTCYFVDLHYIYNGTDFQHVYAACDYGEKGFFVVDAEALDYKGDLSIETIQGFFEFVEM